MSAPNNIIQRRDLSDLVKDYDLQAGSEGRVGKAIMPLFNTELQAGNFPKMTPEDLRQNADTKRQARGTYNRIDFGFDQDNYSCKEYGLEIAVDDALARNYSSYFQAEAEGQALIIDKLDLNEETRIRDIVEGQSANAVSTPWSTAATCTPREDVLTGQKAVRDLTGILPKSMQMTWDKFQEVLVCQEFMESAKYVSNVLALGMETQVSLVRAYLGLDELLLSYGTINTADEGQTVSNSGIWNDTKAFLFIKSGSALQGGPSFGRTMNWTGDGSVNTESYREEQSRSNVLRVRNWRDHKVHLAEAGYLLSNL